MSTGDQRPPADETQLGTETRPATSRPAEEVPDSPELLQADSDETPVLSVVLPTLNEERGVAECIGRIRTAVGDLDVPAEVLVSDSSTDRTAEVARRLGAIVVEPDDIGYGYAYRYAFDRARGEYIAMGDADTTYDFGELPKLFRPVSAGEADIAMGSRLKGDIERGAMPPLHRYVGNPVLTRFLNVFYDADVTDAHSGFRVFTRSALETLDLTSNGMEFASEMVMDASTKGLTIEEVPITYSSREGEATLNSFRDGWRHVRFMLVNSPGWLFLVPAVVFALLGVLIIGVSLTGQRLAGVSLGTHTIVAGGLFCILAVQIGGLGLFSTLVGDPIRRPESPVIDGVMRSFRLEHGAVIGLLFVSLSTGYVVVMFGNWVRSGYTALPPIGWDIVALTVLVVGIQTVFHSFFLSMIGGRSGSP